MKSFALVLVCAGAANAAPRFPDCVPDLVVTSIGVGGDGAAIACWNDECLDMATGAAAAPHLRNLPKKDGAQISICADGTCRVVGPKLGAALDSWLARRPRVVSDSFFGTGYKATWLPDLTSVVITDTDARNDTTRASVLWNVERDMPVDTAHPSSTDGLHRLEIIGDAIVAHNFDKRDVLKTYGWLVDGSGKQIGRPFPYAEPVALTPGRLAILGNKTFALLNTKTGKVVANVATPKRLRDIHTAGALLPNEFGVMIGGPDQLQWARVKLAGTKVSIVGTVSSRPYCKKP